MSGDNDKTANRKTTKSFSGSFSSLQNKPENDFELVLARLKAVFDVETDTDLAKKLDLKQGSISAAKQKKSVPPAWITAVALRHGISADWLLTGDGEMRRAEKTAGEKLASMAQGHVARDLAMKMPGIGFPTASMYNDHEDFDFGEVMAQTIDILKSKTVYTTAIVSNIKAFHKAITTEQQIENMQGQLNQALASFASFQDQLDKTNQVLASLRHENEQLRQELEQSRAGSALSDTG